MGRYQYLKDWRRRMVEKGKSDLIKPDSPNPYIRRILNLAEKYGWDFPFKVAIGKATKEEKRELINEYWERRTKKKLNTEAEMRLLKAIFGGLLNEEE